MTETDLNHIRRCAEQRRDEWMAKHPGVQVPPSEGIDTLRLLAEMTEQPEDWPEIVEEKND